jgi:hypothetical protein
MAAKIVQCSVVVIALFVLSVAVAQDHDHDLRQKLIVLFETALVNDSYNVWKLQQLFFNPDSMQSPEQVCLSVSVIVDTIANPAADYCDNYGAFIKVNVDYEWHFDSYYELHQQVADDINDTSELATLMTKSGSTSMFYTMDPTFYSIMKSMSSSITLSIPYNSDDADYANDVNCASIEITITTELDEMPCWDDAVYALRSVLMWVSLNCFHKN